jgi:N6-L-threonylcarbamoyladenine synthase
MKSEPIKILAIETSCDETAAAVIGTEEPKNGRTEEHPVVLSNIISSQVDLHAKTGGIVPEVASRAHVESIIAVINEALITANNQDTRYKIQTNPKFEYRNSRQIQNPNDQISKPKKLTAISYKLKADLLGQISHLAVTAGPGLIGSLLVGFNTAKAMAYALDIPAVPINHIEGHIYSAFAEEIRNPKSEIRNKFKNSKIQKLNCFELRASSFEFPTLCLTVSGGHTSLTLMRDHGVYENIGSTRDDAAGEAFDKVAQLLGLGFPGGPAVSKLAEQFRNRISKSDLRQAQIALSVNRTGEARNPKQILNSNDQNSNKLTANSSKLKAGNLRLPRPMIDEPNFDFSFSGLKTAVLMEVKKRLKNRKTEELKNIEKEEIAYAFEEAAVDVLVTKTLRAAKRYKPKAVLLAGGVAANRRLRAELEKKLHEASEASEASKLLIAPMELCGDNAAMIGLAAYYHIQKGDTKKWDEIEVDSNLRL